jgi:hypothetical protein
MAALSSQCQITIKALFRRHRPDLCDWLRWADESGEVPCFVQTVADAASIADLPHYSLLRPVLLELKRETDY